MYVTRSFETSVSDIPAAGWLLVQALYKTLGYATGTKHYFRKKSSVLENINLHPRHSVGLEFATRFEKHDSMTIFAVLCLLYE